MDDGGGGKSGKIGATKLLVVFLCVCVLCVFLSVHVQSRINHYSQTRMTHNNPTNQGLVSLSSKLQRHSSTATTKNDRKRKHTLNLPTCLLLHYSK